MDKARDYRIRDEDKVFTIGDKTSKTKSDVHVDYPDKYNLLIMPLVRSELKQDTLLVTLETANEAIYTKCAIKIIGKTFSTSFHFIQSGDTTEIREMATDNCKLVLNQSNFQKGQSVRGHIEFNERCLASNCPNFIIDSKVIGNFVVSIE